MTAWRVIFTDSESGTGIAPVCDEQGDVSGPHGQFDEDTERTWADADGVYDCCPWPHIETYSETAAAELAQRLTELDAGPCL